MDIKIVHFNKFYTRILFVESLCILRYQDKKVATRNAIQIIELNIEFQL